eukprot:168116_1
MNSNDSWQVAQNFPFHHHPHSFTAILLSHSTCSRFITLPSRASQIYTIQNVYIQKQQSDATYRNQRLANAMEAHIDKSPKHEVIPVVSDDDPIRSESNIGDARTADVNTTNDIPDVEAGLAAVLDTALSANTNENENAVAVQTETAPLAKGHAGNINDTPDTEDDEAQPHIPSLRKQKTIRTHFSDVFEFINPIIRYYPSLWIRRDPNNKTTPISNWWTLAFAISMTLLYAALQSFYQITSWNLYPALDNLVWILCYTVVCVGRFLSIRYCAKDFNWPWNRESLPLYYIAQTEINNKERVVKYGRLYIILSIVYVVSDAVTLFTEAEELLEWYHDSAVAYYVTESVNKVFIYWPLMITVNIQSIIFIKYELCLDQLWQEMKDPSTVDLQTTFEEYEKLYKRFKRDYHGTLRLSVAFYLCAEVMFFWDSFNYMGFHVYTLISLLRTLSIFSLFFHAASNLEKVHTRLVNEVWKNGGFFLSKKEFYYTYLLQYMEKYSIYLTVGRVVVTTKNVLKFVFVIMVTRSVMMFGTIWAESKVEEYTATTPAPLFITTFLE